MKAIFSTALAAVILATTATAAGSFKKEVGLQLYSLRNDATNNLPAMLDHVKHLGFKKVETAGTYGNTPEKFKAMLKERGLDPVAGHFPYDRYRDDLDNVVKEAKALGLRYAGCAWITHTGTFDEKATRSAAEVFNRAGAALKKAGIKFFYHVHGYEFHPYKDGTLFDLLMAETDPKLVCYEMDVFWVVYPGQDPVQLLKKYGKRWELMHIKDMKKTLKTGNMSGKADVSNDVTIGTGQMDWKAILREAVKQGVKHYFLEDESPIVKEQLPASLKYLREVKY